MVSTRKSSGTARGETDSHLKARHVTSEKEYRNPVGAAQLGGTVLIGIDVWDDDVTFCTLRIWTDAHGEELIEMRCTERGERLHFSAEYTPRETGVVWYSFDIEASDGAVWRYGAREGWTTGEGAFSYGDPPSFQITVYERRETQPDWYRQGLVYQVFPDRFARGDDWEERAAASLAITHEGVGRRMVEDWDTPPTYERREDGSIVAWDFYGGTLEGVREKLGYLHSLGVTTIYLNPIFEAASNHRYDTADYLRVDPMLGDRESLRRLCVDAREMGISVILDGVFNHCGRDSRYFNAFGNYPDLGAAQSPESPYADWFHLEEDGSYSSWWGNKDLPDINEDSPSYREFMCGKDGVVRRWMRDGVRGWRLDVADELPDDFIAQIKQAVVEEQPDALLLGEVWEDASHKMAYGKLRQYFQGAELDGTMNYPFRTCALALLRNEMSAPEFAARMEEIYENYPHDAFYSALNLLGSHDRERLITVLGGAPDPDTLSEQDRANYRLTKDQLGLAKSRLWVAALLQMTMPGVPCLYYGDEWGLQGFRDPYNRGPMPWTPEDGGDKDCFTIYRNAIAIRKALPQLVDADFEPFAAGDDVVGFWRRSEEGDVCVLANVSLSNARTVRVPVTSNMEVSDVVSGRAPKLGSGQAEVFLWPLGTAVLHFHAHERLQKPLERGMGVLCHITSVPNGGKPGTLGAPARRFVDWLADCGQTYWQVLPVNPTDQYGSPYAGLAAFAGNVSLLERPVAQTLAALEAEGAEKTQAYQDFCEDNEYWLAPYATFRAIKDLLGEGPWQDWPAKYHAYRPELADLPELREGVRRHQLLQFEFEREWGALRSYANERGIKIIGDMPMYVSEDSADVWSEPDIFELGEDGHPHRRAGAPADNLNAEGQLWGNPTYRWDVLAEDGYGWWLRRLGRAFSIYDYVRLDHFIGFSSYYAIPDGKGALEGGFEFGPGIDLFRTAYRQFGPLPLIAEDLGSITPAVRALISQTGAPGMSVVQFSDTDPREGYVPPADTIVYTSTHDTQTLAGWVHDRYQPASERELAELTTEMAERSLAVENDVVMMELQDVLSLDDEARMNRPGFAEGNWGWKADGEAVEAARDHLRELAKGSGRFRS